jgi:dihydroorotate dehydrogenase (NAD+) catalytic subunit
MAADLRVSLGRLALRAPVLAAAGTVGYGLEFRQVRGLERLGALTTKTLTVQPRDGNPPPRLIDTPSGMLNSVGLQNVGLDVFVRDTLPRLASLPIPIIVSVMGETVEDVRALCRRLDGDAGVAAIELNLSCPNLHSPMPPLMVAQDPASTEAFVRAARGATTKPLLAKLSPDVADIAPIARAAEAAGADILSVGNTFTGMSVDPGTRRSRLGVLTGGLSGPAIRPLAVYRVWRVRQAVACPILGVGGVRTAEDVLEYVLAGATAVAVGTMHFADPAASVRVVREVERYLQRHRIASMRELIGAMEQPGQGADGA